ncbi:biotin--[acetyl-CoA-carboxylase] ligase [Flavobacterium tibetense]|jgi:BirA family transcriptional regulator, biotin operon repressor / biotin---[acetyl-CoA-carboxylase] ligase|uniref:Biotin--[acetyl-CoA-carboxylase] ligase n=1 Tax=Flavobacterium tibetense TaxID=2233533 RepID=A0A365P0W5_9FLAO|nr:biotin--[acetyl-CoA-carboxylase] ligase [Flavobacterium tibetense]RBA28110.1 biotin--[acetyl-CoA-carboxylase] ligase [Flavobacterium tibetense]
MNIIKLSAIPSTNTFLKELSATENLPEFTIVVAENQQEGKGQRGSNWASEGGKNLTFSVLVKNFTTKHDSVFVLNILVANALLNTLNKFQIPNVSIKWPNDILSGKKKVAGILIENSFKSANEITSIIGIGLNVNQTNFENLPLASSLAVVANTLFDKDQLLTEIVTEIKLLLEELSHSNAEFLWKTYHQNLFMKDKVASFQVGNEKPFSAVIQGVSVEGKLLLLQEDDLVHEYDIKEIKLLY